jgi:hypothetical protein
MVAMKRLVALVSIVLLACGSEMTPEQVFCDRAVPLLSENSDLGPLEAAVGGQMEELARVAEILPEGKEDPLIVLIDDLTEQLRVWEQGGSADGWSSQDVVMYVGSLCARDDLISWAVMT